MLQITTQFSQPSDEIEISASQEDVHIAVRLSAPNWHIHDAQISHLFQRYSLPSNGKDDQDKNHAGIDLAICRGLIEANGGRIWADTETPPGGTQITFTLPLVHTQPLEGSSTQALRTRDSSMEGSPSVVQILVINANSHMQRYIQESLSAPEFETSFVEDGDQLLDQFDSFNPALVVLDLQQYRNALHQKITQISGISDVPVIFIAPYGMDKAVVKALQAGAVDYIVNPFSRAELVSRVRGALRRQVLPTPFVFKDLQIDYEQRKVKVGERQVELTATEYELLRVLSVNSGRVMNYKMLLRQVWGKRNQGPDDPKAVRAVVKRLRSKLGDSASTPNYVCNERGVGYFIPRANDT